MERLFSFAGGKWKFLGKTEGGIIKWTGN